MKSAEALPSPSASTSFRDRLRGVIAVGMVFGWAENFSGGEGE